MSITKYCVDTGPYIVPGTVYPIGETTQGACSIGPIRYLDVQNNTLQIQLFNNWWSEQISQFGMKVNYYINSYTLSGHDFFYGEEPLAGYLPPISMVMCLTLNNDSIILSKFGIQGNADITAVIAIKTFTTTLSSSALSGIASRYTFEPKAGDLIELSEYGITRPNGRSGQIYEITERVDQRGGEANQLMGHYIWMVKGKRFDYTFEPASPREALSDQVYDNMIDGTIPVDSGIPGEEFRIIESKKYGQNVDNFSRNYIFNYTSDTNMNAPVSGYENFSGYSGQTGRPDTGVYGAYDDGVVLVNLLAQRGGNSPRTRTEPVSGGRPIYIGVPSPNN